VFRKSLVLKSTILIALALFIFFSHFFWDIASYFNPSVIKRWLTDVGGLAPVIYMLIMALAVVISPIPSVPLDVAAGAVFGPFLGTLYSAIGALGGAVISFMITRILGRELIEPLLGGHINFCQACSDKLLTKIVFFSRLIPVVSFDVISYGAGLTQMSLKYFILATFLGMLPLTFVYNYFGSTLGIGKGLAIIFGLIMVGLFFLIPKLIERYNLFYLRGVLQHGLDEDNSAGDIGTDAKS
jgi:uncharacterized membrane protein YdjX (TVP38/TMEM64 family)